MKHPEAHPLAGRTVVLNDTAKDGLREVMPGVEFRVEDYWDRVSGGSWMFAEGNPACLKYAMRTGLSGGNIPLDDEVVYGKIGPFGHLVHVSELGEPVAAVAE